MTVAAKKLADEVLALSVNEREDILQLLRDSLPQNDETVSQEEWDKSWSKELNTRIAEMDSGDDPGVPLDEVLAELEKPIRKP